MKNLHTKLIITICFFVVLTMGSTLFIYHTIIYRATLVEQISHAKGAIENWEKKSVKNGFQENTHNVKAMIGRLCSSITLQETPYATRSAYTIDMPPLILMLLMPAPQITISKVSKELGVEISVQITPLLAGTNLQDTLRFTLIYLILNLILLVALLYTRIRKAFLVPLTELTFQTKALSLEDDVFFHSSYGNQLDDLSHSLNTMLKRIQEYQRELELAKSKISENEKFASTGKMASHLAHDIGTPLNVIQGYTEVILEELNEPETKKYAQHILTEITRINTFIESLLAKDSMKKHTPKADINNICSSIINTLSKLVHYKDIRFTLDAPKDHIYAPCDPEALRHSITNLLINSIHSVQKMSLKSSIHIIITETAKEVSVKICDNGTGIDNSIKPELFTPFTTTKTAGHGLGLFLSKKNIQQTGGSLQHVVNPHFNCCFEIKLPPFNNTKKKQ